MKVNELMVGDWVRVKAPYFKKNKAYRVVEVRFPGHDGVATANIELPDEDEEASMTGEFLFGIPLTPEILEKNGFEDMGFYSECKVGDWSVLCDTKNVAILHREHCNIGTPVEYVHDLQHALRLCGIDKEIKP